MALAKVVPVYQPSTWTGRDEPDWAVLWRTGARPTADKTDSADARALHGTQSTYRAIPRVLNELCSSGRCAGITQDPVADLTAFIGRLAKGPVRVPFINPDGRPGSVALTAADLFSIYDGTPSMFSAITRARFAAALAAARNGDLAPVGRLYREATYAKETEAATASVRNHGDPGLNGMAWFATYCEDTPLPWRGATSMDEKLARLRAAWSAIPATEFAPFPADIALSQTGIQKCLHWDILDTFPTIQPLVPFTGRTLIVNGAWDLRTPLENAQAAAATLPGATLVTVPAEGHSLLGYSPCANRAFADFIAARPVQQCDPVEPFRNAAVAPTSLKAQKPWPGVSGLRSLTLRAVYRTIGDVTYTAYGPGPFVGLRGGTLKPSVSPDRSKYTVTLNKIVYCPGVVVTGTIEMVGNVSHLKVTGAGSHGTLTITAKSITGTLDGKKIRASGSG